MEGSGRLNRRKPQSRRWCCSFTVPPHSPEYPAVSNRKPAAAKVATPTPTPTPSKSAGSYPNSPQNSRLGLVGRMDPRRILSPGRVSPIDSDLDPGVDSLPEVIRVSEPSPSPSPSHVVIGSGQSRSERRENTPAPAEGSSGCAKEAEGDDCNLGRFDVRLNLRGKIGGCLVLELNSEVLSANSLVFAELIANHRKVSRGSSAVNLCRIEVPEVENLNLFRQTVELMFEEGDITRRLMKIGVYRSIDILEVSAGIKFEKGVSSCLKYLEAVPWNEEEEEKLRSLFDRFKFDEATSRDILSRLHPLDSPDPSHNLATQLIRSITASTDTNSRNEMKSLVKGLLSKSSVYEKKYLDINQEDLYGVCRSCIGSLVTLFEEASGMAKSDKGKPLIERISKQVDNLNWMLEILLDRQIADGFVEMWGNQTDLVKMHEVASPMVRYELSRVSAMVFIAIGTRKVHCRSEARLGLFQAWLNPMLVDFGWLQRCKKGLDVKALEEAMGQALLTLPLRQQHVMFMEWFRRFSKNGTECPNLSKAFQIWWRRSFQRGSETNAVESR